MGAKVQCPVCGTMTTHLHEGGDANIPEPGVCSSCEPIVAEAGRAAKKARAEKKARAFLANQAADAAEA